MKLSIYKKREIVKTYEADKYDLMFGVLEDVANAVKLDELKTGSDTEILKMVLDLVMRSMGTVSELMKDIFEGLTDEELRSAKVSEIAEVLMDVIHLTIEQLGKGFGAKNAMRLSQT